VAGTAFGLQALTGAMRRPGYHQPTGRAGHLSRAVAVFACVLLGVLIAAARIDTLDRRALLGGLLFVVLLALVALVAAGVALRRIWRDGARGFAVSMFGGLLSLALLVAPAYNLALYFKLPRLNDVSTDPDSPPVIGAGGPPPPQPADERAALQRTAYPGLAPLVLDRAPGDALDIVAKAAVASGWRILERTAPSAPGGEGRLRAEARTRLFRYPSDVVVQLRGLANGGTRVDLRSASRFGRHDFGWNAANIADFLRLLKEIDEET
jgi:uncharacterized protein (DUF1499 family)